MNKFGVDEAKLVETDGDDRFKRPIAVGVLGSALAVGTVAIIAAKAGAAGSDGRGIAGLLVFAVFAVLIACGYAFIGGRYSAALANRVLGIVGGCVALGGVAFVFYLLLARAP